MPPKRKNPCHGLYYHSTPPKILPMHSHGIKRRSSDDFSMLRLSTIRIWMHEKDIGKLTQALWAGQGNRLRQQASTNPKVKRFLAAVPYVMNSIKDVHQSVVDNRLENLRATMESNVPPELITCKDANGLNVIHKAGGLAHTMMLEYLLSIWPDGAHESDMTGKTPLHWAATAKDNMRSYTLLAEAGCDLGALDYKKKTPIYYKQRLSEIERSFLTHVPDAPRVSQDIPVDWEALASDDISEEIKKQINITNGRKRCDHLGNTVNLLTTRSEASSFENTSEPDLDQGVNTNESEADESTDVEVDAKTLANGYMSTSELETDPASPQKTPEKDQMGDINESPKMEKVENGGNALSDEKSNEDNRVSEVDDNETENADYDENDFEKEIDNEVVQKDIDIKEEKEEYQSYEKLAQDLGTEIEDAHQTESDNEHFDNEVKMEIESENDNVETDVNDIIMENSQLHYDDLLKKQLLNEEEKPYEKPDGSESIASSPSLHQKEQFFSEEEKPYEKPEGSESVASSSSVHQKEQFFSEEEKPYEKPEDIGSVVSSPSLHKKEEEEKPYEKLEGSESVDSSPSLQKIQIEEMQKVPVVSEKKSEENISTSSEVYLSTQNLEKSSSEDLRAKNLENESPPLKTVSGRSYDIPTHEIDGVKIEDNRSLVKTVSGGLSYDSHTQETEVKSDEVKIEDNHNLIENEKEEEKLKKQEEEDDDDDDQVQFGSF